MKAVEGKNFVRDLQSKKHTWKDLKLPEWLIPNLTDHPLMYEKPSIIQAQSIPVILGNRGENYIFQSKNGSGKTGSFAVPAVMAVDPTIKDYQVIIFANSRELINQIEGIMKILVKGTEITVSVGEKGSKHKT